MRLRGGVVRFYFVVFFFKLGGEVSPWERANKTISFSSSCFDGITRKVRLGINIISVKVTVNWKDILFLLNQ